MRRLTELKLGIGDDDAFRLGVIARGGVDLQAQVARQSQELAFYRGVVAQGTAALGIRIGEVRIAAGQKPGQFIVHLSLVRSGRPDNVATGTLVLSVDGESGGGSATLELPALTAGKLREVPFSFRYFENFDQEIAIPPGFKPEHLGVEVRSSHKDVAPLAQTFLWNVEVAR